VCDDLEYVSSTARSETDSGEERVEVDVHQVGVGLVAPEVVSEGLVHVVAALVDHPLDRVQCSIRQAARLPR
jgi:hypothetical protein